MVGPLAAYAAAQPHLTHHFQDRLIGEGIPPGQLGHIFERFYRGGAARSRDNGGAGIGLTISKALIEAHGGTLTASRCPLPTVRRLLGDHALPRVRAVPSTP